MCLIGSKGNEWEKLNRRISGNQLNGITRVELLVVISIIPMLLGLMLPVLQQTRKQAYRRKCAVNLRQISLASQRHAYDNDGFAPPSHSWEELNIFKNLAYLFPNSSGKFPWQYYLWLYCKNFDLYLCPESPISYATLVSGSGPWILFRYSVPALGNPTNDGELPNYLPSNYGYNNFVGGWAGGTNPYEPMRLSMIQPNIGLFSDTYLPHTGYRDRMYSGIHINEDVLGSCNVDFIHCDNTNVVFADGHCEPAASEDAYWTDVNDYNSTIWWPE